MTDADQVVKKMIAAVQTCRRKLAGLEDDGPWRDFLENVVGKRSLREMSGGQLARVLDALRERGAPRTTPAPVIRRDLATRTQSDLIRQLWRDLHELGAVDHAGEDAIGAFVLRMTGVHTLQWLDTRNANRVIEALKSWLNRARELNRVDASKGPAELRAECEAAWSRLRELEAVTYELSSLQSYGYGVTGLGGFEFYERTHWLRLLNRLRRWLAPVERKAKATA